MPVQALQLQLLLQRVLPLLLPLHPVPELMPAAEQVLVQVQAVPRRKVIIS